MQLTKITTGAALAVFLLASCGGKTNTVQLASEQEVAVATEASKEYVVDAASSILKWRGSKLTKDHFGTIQIESGKVNLENEAIKAGTFLIDMKTIVVEDIKEEEYNAKLRNHLASEDFFNIDKFPTAKFDITSSEKLATPDEKGNNYIIKGNLTIKDITKNISIPAKIDIQENAFHTVAAFVIDRTEWDIRFNSGKFFKDLGDKMINDAIEFELTLIAKS